MPATAGYGGRERGGEEREGKRGEGGRERGGEEREGKRGEGGRERGGEGGREREGVQGTLLPLYRFSLPSWAASVAQFVSRVFKFCLSQCFSPEKRIVFRCNCLPFPYLYGWLIRYFNMYLYMYCHLSADRGGAEPDPCPQGQICDCDLPPQGHH